MNTSAANAAGALYALEDLDRNQKVGALLRKGLAKFDRIVKEKANLGKT